MNIISRISLYNDISEDISHGETLTVKSDDAKVVTDHIKVYSSRRRRSHRANKQYYYYLKCGDNRFMLSKSDADYLSTELMLSYGSEVVVEYYENSGIIRSVIIDGVPVII
ncbi:MAG: hypothetical protein IJX77_03905 [Ruminococcus sp.]|nr:hypothetical protein [Ruminococcus sp.]